MNIALFGGAFNPPHNGHVALTKEALAKLNPAKLIWMPVGSPPHKTLPPETPPAKHRKALCKLAVSDLENVEVSDYELRGFAKYTYDTVKHLIEKYSPSKVYLLLGCDAYNSLEHWYRAKELCELVEVHEFSREKVPVSSTEIRKLLSMGQRPEKIPDRIYNYIKAEELYL